MKKIRKKSITIEIGRKYRIFYNKNNPGNQKIHIRAFVDENYIVYRFWSKKERMWQYAIKSSYYFESLLRCNVIFRDGFSKDRSLKKGK